MAVRSVTEYVEGEGSGYVVRVERLDPRLDPALEREGYHSETTLYVVFGGGQVWADHDPHRLVREMPGSNTWLHDEFDRMRDRLGLSDSVGKVETELTLDPERVERIREMADLYGFTWDETVAFVVARGLQNPDVEDLAEWAENRETEGSESE